MSLNKYGSPEKIKIVKKSSFAFDPNIIAKKILETHGKAPMSLDEVHEAVKALGIIDYQEEDMSNLLSLLESSGIKVSNK